MIVRPQLCKMKGFRYITFEEDLIRPMVKIYLCNSAVRVDNDVELLQDQKWIPPLAFYGIVKLRLSCPRFELGARARSGPSG